MPGSDGPLKPITGLRTVSYTQLSERLCTAAAVYTTNKVKGAPVLVTKRHLGMSGGRAKAVIVNSKNANTCNADGVEIAEKISELAAQALSLIHI